MPSKRRFRSGWVLGLLLLAGAATAQTYSLARSHRIGGDGGWDCLSHDPASNRLFITRGSRVQVVDAETGVVIDASTDQLVATIPLRGKPEAAVADGRGGVYVDFEDTNALTAIHAADAKVVATWPLKGCDEPAGLALDAQARRLFVGCHNRTLLVVDADSGAFVGTQPIGAGVDANADDPVTRQVFSAQGDGTLSIIAAPGGDHYSVAQNAATRPGARTLALNTANHEVYLVSADFDELPPAEGSTRPRRVMRPGSFTLLVMRPARP